MANLSKIKRDRMLAFLDKIREAHKDDDDVLISINEVENELLNKRYGLVWEEHSEEVEERMVDEVPVFVEDKDKEITMTDNGYNFLLEGDNLHSLHLLEKTHKEKIDVIYIDPPYNTGNKEFIYDDDRKGVGKDDSFRHSKWLSFMERRLKIAKKLLSRNGVIFISIDDNEGFQLKLLCDSIFGEDCFISDIIWNSRKSVSNDAVVSLNHNYTLVYSANADAFYARKQDFKLKTKPDGFANPDNDPRGLWKADPFDSPGIRPNLTYEITNPNTGKKYLPPAGRCWRTTPQEYESYLADNRIVFGRNGTSKPQLKRFLSEAENKGTTPKSLWDDCGTATEGTKEIMDIFGEKVFDTPKPTRFIKRIIELASRKDSIILDFFAGSGTTGQAVLEVNKEDNGNRKFILCTDNENNICSEITYPRLQTVITGMRQDGNRYSEGIPADLKYYHTAYVSKNSGNLSDDLLDYIDEMIQLEYGVKIDKEKYISILTDEDADELENNWNNYPNIRGIYISRKVLLTAAQRDLFNTKDCFVIPDYYFRNELKEAGEV